MKRYLETKDYNNNSKIEDTISQIKSKITLRLSDLAYKPNCISQLNTLYAIIQDIEEKYNQDELVDLISSVIGGNVTAIKGDKIKMLSDIIMNNYSSARSPFHQFLSLLFIRIQDTKNLDDEFKTKFTLILNEKFNSIPVPDFSKIRKNNINESKNDRKCPPPTPQKKGISKRQKTKHLTLDAKGNTDELPNEIWRPEQLDTDSIINLIQLLKNENLTLDQKIRYSDTIKNIVHLSADLARVVLSKNFFDGVECDQIVSNNSPIRNWNIASLAMFVGQNIKEHKANLEDHIKTSCAKCILAPRDGEFAEVTKIIASMQNDDPKFKEQLENLANTFTSRIRISRFEAILNECENML